jgi:hypothetical protein
VASPRGAQLHGDPAARPARGSGQERHRPGEVSCCRHVRRVWRRKLTARVNVPRPSRGGGSGRSRCPSSPPDETTRVRRTSALGGGRACAVERSSGRAVGQTAGSAQHSALRWSGPPDGCGAPALRAHFLRSCRCSARPPKRAYSSGGVGCPPLRSSARPGRGRGRVGHAGFGEPVDGAHRVEDEAVRHGSCHMRSELAARARRPPQACINAAPRSDVGSVMGSGR